DAVVDVTDAFSHQLALGRRVDEPDHVRADASRVRPAEAGPVACVYSIWSRRALVLVHESAETVPAFQPHRLRLRCRSGQLCGGSPAMAPPVERAEGDGR